MGKKGTAKGKQGEATPAGDEGPTLSGVFSTDLPVLCEQEGLPPLAVKNLQRSSEESVEAEDRHAVLVEYEQCDDPIAIRTLHIRGWLLSERVLSVLNTALTGVQLSSMNLWNVGLNEHTLSLVVQLTLHLNLTSLSLDGNSLSHEPIIELISAKSSLERLSLKCCGISDDSLSLWAQCLSDNKSLLVLDLSCNRIGDVGLKVLSGGLRLNRTLLSLSLTNNRITDGGIEHLAEVVSRFPLNHDEIVLRRKLLSQQRRNDDGQSLLDVGHEPSPRRSPSVLSLDKSGKTSKNEKGGKGKKGEPKKDDTGKGKKDDKGKKGGGDGGKKVKGKESRAGKKGVEQPQESPRPETAETVVNPLLERLEEGEGNVLFMPGNTTIIHLALAYNHVTEHGVQTLLHALRVQSNYSHLGPGLLRITLQHNMVSSDSTLLKELLDVLQSKDPVSAAEPELDVEDEQTTPQNTDNMKNKFRD